jgi:hypothetical protein
MFVLLAWSMTRCTETYVRNLISAVSIVTLFSLLSLVLRTVYEYRL